MLLYTITMVLKHETKCSTISYTCSFL